jgi:Uma2 family endonuclease
MVAPAARPISYGEYLAAEARRDVKHEFHDGTVVAMAGGSPEHSLLCARLLLALGNALEAGNCRPFESNLRLYLPAARRGLYPDASVICGRLERDPVDPDAATNPTLIAEVLSPSTEAYDRGQKFELYQTLHSFTEYLLVASQRVRVEVVRREPDGAWRHEYFGAGDSVLLRSLGIAISVDDVYRGWADLVQPESPESA